LVTGNPDIQTVYITGSIPARQVSVEMTDSQSITTSGGVTVPNEKAKGNVQFRNLTEQDQTIPAGTVIRTSSDEPVRFVTLDVGKLKGGLDETIDVPVEALEGVPLETSSQMLCRYSKGTWD